MVKTPDVNNRDVLRPTACGLPIALLAAAALAGCSDDGGPRAITRTREVDVEQQRPVKLHATSRERFESPFSSGGGAHGADGAPDPHAPQSELAWKLPEGWVELPPTEHRHLNFSLANGADWECYLSAAGGTLIDNVNRWRRQFGAEPLDAAEVAALPAQSLLGAPATRVEVAGTFQPMEGDPKPGFALVGLIAYVDGQGIFLRMSGPQDVIAAERERFDGFVHSMRLEAARPPEAVTLPSPGESPGIRFEGPPGWTRKAAQPPRVATFTLDGRKDTECAVFVFPGDTGGIEANVNRWRGQLGLAPLSWTEVEALPRTPMLGRDGVVLDCVGEFSDPMTNRTIPQARFLGAIVTTGERAVFAKLTGPETEVDETVKDAFLALCASLQE